MSGMGSKIEEDNWEIKDYMGRNPISGHACSLP